MVDISKVVKVAGKLAMPIFSGVMTVVSELESQKQKQIIKELMAEVAELKSKVK